MLARVYTTAFPSVCLCVTRVLCIKTAKHFVEILSPPDSPIILVFRHCSSLLNFDGFTPNGGAECKEGGDKIGRFLTNKSMCFANGARCGHSCYKSHTLGLVLNSNRLCVFRIYTVGHKKTCHFYFFDNSGKY